MLRLTNCEDEALTKCKCGCFLYYDQSLDGIESIEDYDAMCPKCYTRYLVMTTVCTTIRERKTNVVDS